MEDVHKSINICPTNPIQTNMKFFEDFVCVLQMILLTKKILMSVLGLNSKDRKSTRDKVNISDPKVNRGCAPLTANRISADCVQISLGPSIPYIPLGVYHTGGFNALMTKSSTKSSANMTITVTTMHQQYRIQQTSMMHLDCACARFCVVLYIYIERERGGRHYCYSTLIIIR